MRSLMRSLQNFIIAYESPMSETLGSIAIPIWASQGTELVRLIFPLHVEQLPYNLWRNHDPRYAFAGRGKP